MNFYSNGKVNIETLKTQLANRFGDVLVFGGSASLHERAYDSCKYLAKQMNISVESAVSIVVAKYENS